MRAAAIVAGVCLLAGCATVPTRAGFIELEESGSVSLLTRDDRLHLTGELARELAGVAGAHVKVWGTAVGKLVSVNRYQILDAGNGFFAYVGFVRVDQTGCHLIEWPSGRAWQLGGLDPDVMRDHHGAKAWVTGIEEGPDRIHALDWGLLGPPDTDR